MTRRKLRRVGEIERVPPEAQALLTHRSSKLLDILKVLLCYSNNFMAERIGETIGGPQAVRALLIDKLKINPSETQKSFCHRWGTDEHR